MSTQYVTLTGHEGCEREECMFNGFCDHDVESYLDNAEPPRIAFRYRCNTCGKSTVVPPKLPVERRIALEQVIEQHRKCKPALPDGATTTQLALLAQVTGELIYGGIE